MRPVVLALALGGCIAIGPTRIGLLPPMAPVGETRDPDPTRVPNATNQPGGVESGDEGETPEDPVTVGPVSGGVTATSFLLGTLVRTRMFLGLYGTFDENRLVEPDPPPSP